jgi:hypothetical protein
MLPAQKPRTGRPNVNHRQIINGILWAADRCAVASWLSTGAVKRPGRGRPQLRPKRIVGDKGYCGKPVRDLLRRRGIRLDQIWLIGRSPATVQRGQAYRSGVGITFETPCQTHVHLGMIELL